MEKYFSKVHTIEVSEELWKNVKNKYKGNKITFHLGDSGIVLNNLSSNLNNNAVFFLDGHFSNGDTNKGEKDVPLLEELNHINKKFKYEGIIIIDDCRLFGKIEKSKTGGKDIYWNEINEESILNILKSRTVKYYYKDSIIDKKDRLIIHISALN